MTHPTAKAGDIPSYPCGHPRTAENTYIGSCRECRRIRSQQFYEKHRQRQIAGAVAYAAWRRAVA